MHCRGASVRSARAAAGQSPGGYDFREFASPLALQTLPSCQTRACLPRRRKSPHGLPRARPEFGPLSSWRRWKETKSAGPGIERSAIAGRHLAITLCRCMNIPARYCTGYLGDIGVPVNPNPMDFSGWAEVFLNGRWYTSDARHNHPASAVLSWAAAVMPRRRDIDRLWDRQAFAI
jgi:hypothetical protein